MGQHIHHQPNGLCLKMRFSIKDFFSKSDQFRRKLDLVTFMEEIRNEKLYF